MRPVREGHGPLAAPTLAWWLVMLTALVPTAEAYDPIGWTSIDGGGHFHESGGSYRLSGTIGQHDAGALAGGVLTLAGGFWHAGSATTVDVLPQVVTPYAIHFRAPAPNPARSRSGLSFDLSAPADARLRVHDVSGRTVRTWEFGRLSAGRHDRTWDTVDDAGRSLPSGVYFLRLEVGAYQAQRKVLVLR